MKRWLAAMLMLLMFLSAGAMAEGGRVYWTNSRDVYFHSRKDCGENENAVPVSEEAAWEFAKLPCPKCTDGHDVPNQHGADYNTFADTTVYDGIYMPLREEANVRYEFSDPLLVGKWMYYVRSMFKDTGDMFDSGADKVSICRCPVEDMQREEVLVEDTEVGLIDGMLDTGKDLLLWYTSSYHSTTTGKAVNTAKFWRMSYDGKERRCIAEQRIGSHISSVVMADGKVWFNWYELSLRSSGHSEIYEMSLDDAKPKLICETDGSAYTMYYAYGKLYFAHLRERLEFCAFDPESRELSVLHSIDGAPYDGEEKRFIIVDKRMYLWSNDKNAMISMDLNGGDVKKISSERFGFRQTWRGYVIATKLKRAKSVNMWYGDDSTYVYAPKTSAFLQDTGKRYHIGRDDFMLGDWFFQYKDGAWKVTDKT